jgi:hypothetical protein
VAREPEFEYLEALAVEDGVEAAAELAVAIVDREAEWRRPLRQ